MGKIACQNIIINNIVLDIGEKLHIFDLMGILLQFIFIQWKASY